MERTNKSPESTRIKRLFERGFRRVSEEQLNGRVLWEAQAPGHDLVMRAEDAEAEALINSGHLKKEGETSVYVERPRREIVVRVVKALVVGTLTAAVGFEFGVRHGQDIRKLTDLARRRRGREKLTP